MTISFSQQFIDYCEDTQGLCFIDWMDGLNTCIYKNLTISVAYLDQKVTFLYISEGTELKNTLDLTISFEEAKEVINLWMINDFTTDFVRVIPGTTQYLKLVHRFIYISDSNNPVFLIKEGGKLQSLAYIYATGYPITVLENLAKSIPNYTSRLAESVSKGMV